MQFWTSKRQNLGAKVSLYPPGSVSFPKVKPMIPWFWHNIDNGMALDDRDEKKVPDFPRENCVFSFHSAFHTIC